MIRRQTERPRSWKLAETIICHIDAGALWSEREHTKRETSAARRNGRRGRTSQKRIEPPSAEKHEIFGRDNYTCCYCGKRTIALEVLEELHKLIPDVLPYHPDWKMDETHPVYWTHSTSYEHVTPVADGGENDEGNVRAACAQCNYAKNDIPLEDPNWTLRAIPAGEDGWSGLMGHLAQLEAVVDRHGGGSCDRIECSPNSIDEFVERSSASYREDSEVGLGLSPGDHVRAFLPGKRSRRTYRVESVLEEGEKLILREIWHEQASGKLVESGLAHQVQLSELDGLEITLKESRG